MEVLVALVEVRHGTLLELGTQGCEFTVTSNESTARGTYSFERIEIERDRVNIVTWKRIVTAVLNPLRVIKNI